jgi:hypothetical protein
MIRIPYGKSNYRTLVEENYFYQDRTTYIKTLEDWDSTYLMYLRPRRFGKSLLLSTLQYYYGLQFQAEFDKLFGHTFIGKNPTRGANKYMVLTFDFSGIRTAEKQDIFSDFTSNVLKGLRDFIEDYKEHFSNEQITEILRPRRPNEAVATLFTHLHKSKSKIYILIDDYDYFVNELTAFDFSSWNDIVAKVEFSRKFYEVLKVGAGEGLVHNIFMTGIVPITLHSLTSGFNIGTNITLSARFHTMVGFDEKAIEYLLAGVEMPIEAIPKTLNDMRLWYDGYLFSPDLERRCYNPNMILHFAREYEEQGKYPQEMLDPNVASDYNNIQKILSIQGKEGAFLDILSDLFEHGEVKAVLTSQYNFERRFTYSDLVSLLFYMGFLTIKSERLGGYTFSFPNYVIKKLYADYFFNSILEKAQLPFNNKPVNDAIEEMAETGNPKAFFEQVKLILKYFSTRDSAHFNENTLKATIISLLHQQKFYYIHSEYETNWTYMDVFLEAIRGQKPQFEVAMELKYAEKAGKKAIETIFNAAKVQLQGYLDTPKFNTRTNIKSFVVVVAGDKLEWRPL